MKRLIPGRENTDSSRGYEELFLKEVNDYNDRRNDTLKKRLNSLQDNVKAFKQQYEEEGDLNVYNLFVASEDEYEKTANELKDSLKKGEKPYFGRLIYDNETIYIGKTGIVRDQTDILVADWRAPISNAYYENGLGAVHFQTPAGDDVNINVSLKRTFDIENSTLIDYYDSDAVTDDELLNKYLAQNKQAVLSEIIATIQKEQNDIIRLTPKHNLIVQGVAGSGKTTVAMHRISYLLYNFGDILRPEDFYVIGSNKMLLKYITGVLPGLGVDGFGQMTMEELFTRLLYSQWDHFKYSIRETDTGDPIAAGKGSSRFFFDLKEYCDKLERERIKAEDVILDPNEFTEGIENGVVGIYDRRNNPSPRKGAPVTLLRGSAIKKYIEENPQFSVQTKINALNEELIGNVENELLIKGVSYTEKEKNAIKRRFTDYYGKKKNTDSVYEIYSDFIESRDDAAKIRPTHRFEERLVTGAGANGTKTAMVKIMEYDVYDLAALAYIYHRIPEDDPMREASHIVIDEAQDYGMMAYYVLKACVHDCKYTIMGDVSQNIRYSSGLNDWQELRELYLPSDYDSFMMLKKSYRNTIEISAFATEILKHGTFEIYPCEPIIRHGDEPVIIKEDKKTIPDKIAALCREYEQEGLFSIAVICRDKKRADELKKKLDGKLELVNTDDEESEYGQGVMVLPVNLTKGLEFDAVIIYEPDPESYPEDNSHVKLMYVAATRAMHKLCVIYSDKLSKLFEKKADDEVRVFAEEKRVNRLSREEERKLEEEKRDFLKKEEEYAKQRLLEESGKSTKEYLENRMGVLPKKKDSAAGGETGKSGAKEKARTGIGTDRTRGIKPDNIDNEDIISESDKIGSGNSDEALGKNDLGNGFLDQIDKESLAPSGHSLGSFATKWVHKKKDGIYFQSQDGVLRLQPIAQNIVRVSFSKGFELNIPKSDRYRSFQMTNDMRVKESSQAVEVSLKKMVVSFDKYRGALTFYDANKRLILKESQKEARYVDIKKEPVVTYTFFEGDISDPYYIYSSKDDSLNFIKQKARQISDGEHIPCVIKKDKYAIIPLTLSKAGFSHIPVIGTFIMQEDSFSDYYLIVEDDTEKLKSIYGKLVSKP